MLCVLICMYRSFPFMFSLFVSASPVLVCTAVLLGTLLSFGQPNIPEIEKEEKVSHEIASLKKGVVEDNTTIVERGESFPIERYVGKKRDVVENSVEGGGGVSDFGEDDGGSVDYTPLIDESLREIQCEKQVVDEEMKREFDDSKWEKKREIHDEELGVEGVLSDWEVVENHFSLVGEGRDKNLEVEDGKSPGESTDVHKRDFSPSSSWKRGGEDEDEGDDGDGDQSSDSGSDGAESSSPDASMADIIPMLDELHPLLDLDAPQPAHMSLDGSDAGSERSHKSNDSSVESEEDIEKQAEEEEDGEDDAEEEEDGEDDDEEGEAQGGKEDGSKSAITWTEADQKNLMDLGTLELERNQRLESLIARRRARKSMKLMAEKNLIDLDGADLPFNVPTISTSRKNPFDLPYDSYDDMGLPPIPGSAPSILLARRNPFDLPYDSNEEKPDLKGDSFQQEFTVFQQREAQQKEAFQQREAFFRRHESFSVGPSSLGGLKRDRHDVRFKPYFVPEGVASEGTSYPTFQRQLSEVSESKSSVPDTESVSSAVDDEDKKLNEQDVSQETELISNIDHASDHVERGSQSSGIDSLDTDEAEKRDVHHDEVEITLGDVECHHEMASSLSETGGAAASVELNTNQIHPNTEPVEEVCSSRSSLSSLSEVDERISDVRKEEESSSLEPRGNQIGGSGISTQASFAESDFQFTSELVDDIQHREPVYDSSPPAMEKYLSFSSVSSDTPVEISEMGSPPVSSGSAYKESEVHGENIEMDSSNIEKMHASSSQVREANENQSRSREVTEISEQDVTKVEPSVVSSYDNQNGSVVPEFVVEHNPVESGSSSLDTESVEEGMTNKEEILHHEQDQVHPSSHDAEILAEVHQGMFEKLDSPASWHQMASEESTSSAPEEQQPSMVVEHVSADLDVSSSEIEPVKEHAIAKGEIRQLQQDGVHSSSSSDNESVEEGVTLKDRSLLPEADQVHSSSFDAEIHDGDHPDVGKKLDKVATSYQPMPFNDLILSAPEEQQPPLVAEQVSEVHSNLPSSEPEHVEEHSSNKEGTLQFEQDQVQSSSSGAKVDAGVHQDMDVKVASSGSSHLDGRSEEKMPSELVMHPSWSDKSMVEPTFDDLHESHEPCDILAESTDEVSITSNVNVPEFHDPKDKILTNISSVTSDSASVPSESPEYKPPTAEEDMKESMLDRIAYEDNSEASEQLNNSVESYGFHNAEQNFHQEADEIKEIDEGLLSELDSVGDFSVKEVVGEALHAELIPEETNSGIVMLPEDSNLTETNLELPVLEARSVEDIELAFKQLHEGVDVEEVILPSMIEDQSKDPVETNSDIPVVEARSLVDINIALKQVSEGNLGEQPKPLESKAGSSEVEANEVPVVEARSLEDINIALKQVSVGNLSEQPKWLESKAGSSEVEANEVVSTKEIESSNVESGVQESSMTVDEPKHGFEETPENSSFSKTDRKGKKAKSPRSRSSSSSSSSESSSDSD